MFRRIDDPVVRMLRGALEEAVEEARLGLELARVQFHERRHALETRVSQARQRYRDALAEYEARPPVEREPRPVKVVKATATVAVKSVSEYPAPPPELTPEQRAYLDTENYLREKGLL